MSQSPRNELSPMGPIGPAPPTTPGQLRTGRTSSSWPAVIGIISLIYAMLGFLGYAGMIFAMFIFVEWRMDDAAMDPSMALYLPQWRVWLIAVIAGGLLLSLLLLGAAVGLMMRSTWVVRVMLIWAVLSLLETTGYYALNVLAASDVPEPDSTFVMSGVASFVNAAWMVIGVLFNLFWPIFILIWFTRAKIRQEVAGWG